MGEWGDWHYLSMPKKPIMNKINIVPVIFYGWNAFPFKIITAQQSEELRKLWLKERGKK